MINKTDAPILRHQNSRLRRQLKVAYDLINSFLNDLPPCNCHEAYKGRNMVDPNCAYHNAIYVHTHQQMVEWRNSFDTPEKGWMIE